MRQTGSQTRETLREAGYDLHQRINSKEVVLLSDAGQLELWVANDHHFGYTIEIDGVGYEYISSVSAA